MDNIAILIPCYNEEKTIGKVVRDFKEHLPEATIYVYDNNSTDKTKEVAKENGAIVRSEYIQGKGNVIRRMFREIDAKAYIMVDGDDTYPAKAAKELVSPILYKNADMVIGDRLSSTYFEENKRPFHNFGNVIVRKAINKLFKNNVKDIMTGYRAFSFEFAKTFPICSKGFEIETEMTIHAVEFNMQIEHIVVDYKDRPMGSESKLSTYSDGFKVLKMIVDLFRTYHPFAFFGYISLIIACLSFFVSLPVIIEYARTGLVLRFPTLIVCGFTMITAIMLFIAGIILQNLLKKEQKDFEFKLQQVDMWYKIKNKDMQ